MRIPRFILYPSSFLLCLSAFAQTPPPEPAEPVSPDTILVAPPTITLTAPPAKASAPSGTAVSGNIHATSDLISMDTTPAGRRRMLFTGHVKILGGGLVGTCDRMEIFGPDPGASTSSPSSTESALKSEISNLKSASPSPGIGAFSRVVATGSVTLTSNGRTALSEKAEIFPDTAQLTQPGRIVLSGKPRLTDGTQQITGGIITYSMTENRVDVETDPAKPDERPTVTLESFP